jgi:hypothetical protein
MAGFMVSGEAKNWEKFGSCAFETLANAIQQLKMVTSFFISAIKFFHWSDKVHFSGTGHFM